MRKALRMFAVWREHTEVPDSYGDCTIPVFMCYFAVKTGIL